MKKLSGLFLSLFFFSVCLAETVEYGSVKEYHGSADKTVLPGVELQIKGAQSTVSDADGSFVLHFATLKPGEKVNYTDIYKEGYVIFNKDALDAWRISNNGRPFVIVMCKESDFRALKKKFYGIIEKSYYDEYLRQRELAAKTALTAQQLESKLKEVENEYQEKMSNINSYVELFSRIDRNEMDSVEAKALEYMENGQIAEAIKTYEELQLQKEMETQFSKWDAAEEMRRAANGMESEAQADLLALVDKMQKQISLYEMGGYEYSIKRFDMMGDLVKLLYRLKPITGDTYNELLGQLIVKKTDGAYSPNRLSAYKEAADIPSVAGLVALARFKQIAPPSEALVDSIRGMLNRAIGLLNADNDSSREWLLDELALLPEGYYHHSDGNNYAYRLLSDSEAILTGQGPWFSTHLEGDAEMPTTIRVEGKDYNIVGLDNFSFGNNKKLRSVKLPRHCRYLGVDAFKGCDSLVIIINPELEEILSTKVSVTIPPTATLYIPETPKSIDWINAIMENVEPSDTTHNVQEFYLALSRYYENQGDYDTAFSGYEWLGEVNIANKNLPFAKKLIKDLSKINKKGADYLYSKIYEIEGDYKNALKSAVKGLNDKYPYTYNRVAYMFADPKYGPVDFAKAHTAVDHAISVARNDYEKANYIDTKGELYLREGNEEKAKELLGQALAIYPEYNSGASVLYAHFYPDVEPQKPQTSEEETAQDEELIQKQRIRNIAIALMASDFLSPKLKDAPLDKNYLIENMEAYISLLSTDSEEFREAASIFFYRCLNRVGTLIFTYCYNNNVPFNNEWSAVIDGNGNAGMDKDIRWHIVSLMNMYQIGKRLPAAGLLDNEVEQIFVALKGIENYINQHPGVEGQVVQALMDGHDVPYIKDTFGYDVEKIEALGEDLWAYVYKFVYSAALSGFKNIPYSGELENSEISQILEKTKQQSAKQSNALKNYIDIVQRIAKLEHKKLPHWDNFMLVDYEELVSIGILAVQVLIKNKTPEQLERYNDLYIATAVLWAINNELKIRYQWYDRLRVSNVSDGYHNELDKQYQEAGIDYQRGQVRLAVYSVLARVGRTYEDKSFGGPLDFVVEGDSKPQGFELEKMWEMVKNYREDLSEEYRECYDAFFSPQADYTTLQYRFSPSILQGMFNEIKEILNQNGFYGY